MIKDAGKRGEAWFNDSLDKLEGEAENELESVRLSKELKQRWPAEYKDLEELQSELKGSPSRSVNWPKQSPKIRSSIWKKCRKA